eukprot:SAG22_NODE_5567_length_991_cov_5.686099_1_plen_77_part_00
MPVYGCIYVDLKVLSPPRTQLSDPLEFQDPFVVQRLTKLWDVASGECLRTLEGHSSSVNSVAFEYVYVHAITNIYL